MRIQSYIPLLALLWCMLATHSANGQAQLHLDNEAFIVIDDSAFLVIGNPASNALLTGAGGGNIVCSAKTVTKSRRW